MVDIEWLRVEPGTIWVGDDRGALLHAGNGPRHQIHIAEPFEISAAPVTFAQWAELTGQRVAGEDSDDPINRLTPLMVDAGLTPLEDLRTPSEAEWTLASDQGCIAPGGLEVELLADRPPRSGYWGAPCDGSPWLPPIRAGGVSDHSAHTTRVWRGESTVRGATPRGVSRPQMGFRLVRAPEREALPRLPRAPNRNALLAREAGFALVLGILPSFTWAFFNASSRYISESWVNIAVGGIFFSLMTALLWRPRTPKFEIDGDRMRRV